MNEFWIKFAFHWLIGQFLVMSVLRWAEQGRFRARPASERLRLTQPRAFLAIAVAGLLGLAGVAWLGDRETLAPDSAIGVALIGLMALAILQIADHFMERYDLSAAGISFRGLLRRPGHVQWAEVERIQYSRMLLWFVLHVRGGRRLRVSVMLAGIPEFARHLLRHAPAAAIGPDVRPILESSARGAPPSLLGPR